MLESKGQGHRKNQNASQKNLSRDSLKRGVFNSMVYGSADPCFALSDKKIKLHILSDPKNKIGISKIFYSRRSR